MTTPDPYERAADPANIAERLWFMMGFDVTSPQQYFVTGAYQVSNKEEGEVLKRTFEEAGKYNVKVELVIDDDNDGREYWVVSIKTDEKVTLTKQLLKETIKEIKDLGKQQGLQWGSFGLDN